MGVQKLVGRAGLSKQTAKASLATDATYGVGVMDGNVFEAPIEQDYEAFTLPGAASDRFHPAVNRTLIQPGMSGKVRAHPRLAPLLLLGALGGISTTGPVGNVYTHTIVPALTLPYLTHWGQFGPTKWVKTGDMKIDELTIAWEGTQPWEIEATLLAAAEPDPTVSAPTVTNDETVQAYIGPNAGTFQLDVDGTTLAAEPVTGASLTIANNLDPIVLSTKIHPDDLQEASQTIEGTIKVKPADLHEWQAVLTGSPSGASLSAAPVYGSFSLKGVLDADNDLTLASTRAAFLVEFPESDPAGGATELELAFTVVRPLDASPAFTATMRNTVASY
jgi:hypothetical protein